MSLTRLVVYNTIPWSVVELRTSWNRAWNGIGARTDGGSVLETLLVRYSEPHRRYHSLQHLSDCISVFESVLSLAERSPEVELALWFHDAIYDTARFDNEAQSAIWARTVLLEAGAPPESAERVHSLVMVTRHAVVPTVADEQLLVDIDLSILGAPEHRFAEYERQIREEYAMVPVSLFWSKRLTILRAFLKRPNIYNTDHFRVALEERARENLRRAISAGVAHGTSR